MDHRLHHLRNCYRYARANGYGRLRCAIYATASQIAAWVYPWSPAAWDPTEVPEHDVPF